MSLLHALLAHPRTRGLDLDDPKTTALRASILSEKAFLRRIYEQWCQDLAAAVPPGPGRVLELGSGAGFLKDRLPEIISSDLLTVPGLDLVADARALPLATGSLKAVLMTNVLHHIPDPRAFFTESARCVRPGGVIAMIEPWVTPWSRFVYRRLHPEPFNPEAPHWTLPPAGPLSGANGALPWIIFHRDRPRFARLFPQWSVRSVRPIMPFMYLASGGVSLRALQPGCMFPLWRIMERLASPWLDKVALFAEIVVVHGNNNHSFD